MHDGTCTESEADDLIKWTEDAIDKIETVRACTASSCSELVGLSLSGPDCVLTIYFQVETWFGSQTTQTQLQEFVTNKFDIMADKVSDTIYSCNAADCESSTFAYVSRQSLLGCVLKILIGPNPTHNNCPTQPIIIAIIILQLLDMSNQSICSIRLMYLSTGLSY